MRTIQLTLIAGANRVTSAQIYSPFITIQNNSAAGIRIGDNTVSATKGMVLPASTSGGSASMTVQRADNRILLNQYYIFGTPGSVIDIIYE